MRAPLPATEVERLAALRSYAVLDTPHEEALDDIVALAARLTASPVVLISLVDAERQWFKAAHGVSVTETPRDLAFCAHAILEPRVPLIVPDATRDPRFADNPFVAGEPNIRSYLGFPLVSPEGHALGTLCAIDYVPRTHSDQTVAIMRTLARAVVANLELRRALLRARHVARTDALTGLPNRRAVVAELGRLMAAGRSVGIVAADLDDFRKTTSVEGPEVGDVLLLTVARRLRETVRPGDVVGRTGDDEFVCLLADVAADDTARVAERLSQTLQGPVRDGVNLPRLGVTLGVARVPTDAQDPEVGLRLAREAAIRAKQDAKGGIGWASQEDVGRLRRVTAIVRSFDARAGDGDDIPDAAVHLQPILNLRKRPGHTLEVVAVEALARWSHPFLGEVPLGELLPTIGSGRAVRLGAAVRGRAFAAFAKLRAKGLTGTRVAVNLSEADVSRPDIALRVAEQAEAAGLSLREVEVEITEEVLLDRVSDRTLDQLATLRGRGARLVLDDFGTGNSGLSQLLRLPIDGVKLDKRFIQGLAIDPRAEEIVRATVSLAHGLGLSVVGEGIETEQQHAMLLRLGCDAGQGFLFARPMPPDQLEAWLRERALREPWEVIPLVPKAARR